MSKYTVTATGRQTAVKSRGIATYYADFDTGSAVATARLEFKMGGGDWVPADESVNATMTQAKVCETVGPSEYAWNVTSYTSGTLYLYLKDDIT